MSRIGKYPVAIPDGVSVEVANDTVTAKGKLGELHVALLPEVSVAVADGLVTVTPRDQGKKARSMWGTTRSQIANAVTGVHQGFTVNLEISGVGYRAAVEGQNLVLALGFSHPVNYPIPQEITVKCERPTAIAISGSDKQKAGQMASEIRAYRPPEPFKGKGVRYADEKILRKEGKKK